MAVATVFDKLRTHSGGRAGNGGAYRIRRDSRSFAAPKVISWPVSLSVAVRVPSAAPSRRVPLVEPRSRNVNPCRAS